MRGEHWPAQGGCAVGMNRTTLRWISSAFLLVALMLPASVPAAAFAAPGPAVGPAISADHLVTQISLGPRTPNILQDNDSITISFSYSTTEAGGVRIFARPFTGGALTPSYAASGSPLYPVGTGVGSGNFTITTGNVTVDQIRFQMLDANQTTVLFEAFIPVSYQFTSKTSNVISHIGLTATPNVLKRNQRVSVSFNYTTTLAAGVRIFARPLTGGSLTPSYAASGSPLYPTGAGTGSGWFTITSGAPTVTQVQFQMWNANQRGCSSRRSSRSPTSSGRRPTSSTPSPSGLEIRTSSCSVTANVRGQLHDERRRRRAHLRAPLHGEGALTPNYAAHPSPLYPVGTGAASGWLRDQRRNRDGGPDPHPDVERNQTGLLFQTRSRFRISSNRSGGAGPAQSPEGRGASGRVSAASDHRRGGGCGQWDSRRPALTAFSRDNVERNGAGDEVRTRDIQLGKAATSERSSSVLSARSETCPVIVSSRGPCRVLVVHHEWDRRHPRSVISPARSPSTISRTGWPWLARPFSDRARAPHECALLSRPAPNGGFVRPRAARSR